MPNTLICIIREKFILDLFENILTFPYLSQRLKKLKENKLFDSLEKKVINKIAFNLNHMLVPIGTSIYTEEFHPDSQQIVKFVYYIVKGELKIYQKNNN